MAMIAYTIEPLRYERRRNTKISQQTTVYTTDLDSPYSQRHDYHQIQMDQKNEQKSLASIPILLKKHWEKSHAPAVLFITDLCVAPHFRDMGIATKLVKRLLSQIPKSVPVTLNVVSPAAVALYHKCGFVCTKKDLFKDYVDDKSASRMTITKQCFKHKYYSNDFGGWVLVLPPQNLIEEFKTEEANSNPMPELSSHHYSSELQQRITQYQILNKSEKNNKNKIPPYFVWSLLHHGVSVCCQSLKKSQITLGLSLYKKICDFAKDSVSALRLASWQEKKNYQSKELTWLDDRMGISLSPLVGNLHCQWLLDTIENHAVFQYLSIICGNIRELKLSITDCGFVAAASNSQGQQWHRDHAEYDNQENENDEDENDSDQYLPPKSKSKSRKRKRKRRRKAPAKKKRKRRKKETEIQRSQLLQFTVLIALTDQEFVFDHNGNGKEMACTGSTLFRVGSHLYNSPLTDTWETNIDACNRIQPILMAGDALVFTSETVHAGGEFRFQNPKDRERVLLYATIATGGGGGEMWLCDDNLIFRNYMESEWEDGVLFEFRDGDWITEAKK